MKKIFFSAVILAVLAGAFMAFMMVSGFWNDNNEIEKNKIVFETPKKNIDEKQNLETESDGWAEANADENESEEEKNEFAEKTIIQDVPFVVQAPFGKWNDPLFQDGCEEAAILMVRYWIAGEKITEAEAEKEILKLVEFEKNNYKFYLNTSIEKTAEIMRDYLDYENIKVKDELTGSDEIICEVMKENLVIVPMDGRKLGNPFYTPPGPENHMLVIIGYDAETGEFITNDSGTKRGKNYRYDPQVLFNAIRDYPSGHKEPNSEISKTMIVIEARERHF